MSRRYDQLTTIFTPDGRLLQVEYANSNIEKAGLCVGVTTTGGVVLACEKESTSKLLERSKASEKLYKIDSNLAVGVLGLAADANLLIDYAREYSQNYYFKYKSLTPVENIVRYVCDVKQLKTQFGSTRPYGAGFLFAGWDKIYGYQLYNTDPSGVYSCWKAHALGQNHQNAQNILKQYYTEDISLENGITLAIRVLKKTLDKNKMVGDNIDILVLSNTNGVLGQSYVKAEVIDGIIKELVKEEEEEEKNRQK